MHWRVRFSGESFRAFAIDCQPWFESSVVLSLLTEHEQFDETKNGKWCMAEWRFYNFTSDTSGKWPAASTLSAEAFTQYALALSNKSQAIYHAQLELAPNVCTAGVIL